MKPIIFILFLLFAGNFSFSQEKTELGISTEGSWFMPHKEIEYLGWAAKNGFGAGIGAYASRNLYGRLSADIGLSYRYKQMKQHYTIYTGGGGYGDPDVSGNAYESNAIRGWEKLPLHYVVVPVRLQMLLSKSFFIRGGIESTWLTNYEVVNEKPEFNWTLGFGSQKYKLKWSVNYIRGFAEQGFSDKTPEADGHYRGSINRNTMLQLNLSYPIWQIK